MRKPGPSATRVVGIDLGGTKIHAALGDGRGGVLAERRMPTDPRGGSSIIDQLGVMIDQMRLGDDGAVLGAVGLVGPGAVAPGGDRFLLAPNIEGLADLDLAGGLQARFGAPVILDNDANGAAWGEWRQADPRVASLAFIAIGTGIGMGVVADGRLLHGRRGAAGEIAYLPLGADPYLPRHQRRGPLEEIAGGRAIAERYAAETGSILAADEIFERAPSDPVAARLVEESAAAVAEAIVSVRAIIDPDRVVLGGGIGARRDFAERIVASVARLGHSGLEVVVSELGESAALIGALALAENRLDERLP